MKKLSTTCLATLLASSALSMAQAPVDPFRAQAAAQGQPAQDNRPKNVSICYECFSLGIEDAAKLLRERPDDTILYGEIVDLVAKKKAKQESLTIIRARSGQKGSCESISEMIYPTVATPPSIPNTITLSGQETAQPAKATEEATPNSPTATFGVVTPATPTSFETRNTGFSLEIEPTIGEDDLYIDLRMLPDWVTFTGRSAWGQGAALTEMPEFESQRINSAYTLRSGKAFLVGTMNRPPISKVDPESSERVWFSFVTPTLVSP